MREIQAEEITSAVAEAIKNINFHIRPDVKAKLQSALEKEASPLGRQSLQLLLENAQMAAAGILPLCQDTGTTVIFAEVGQEVRIMGASLEEALQAGVRLATREGRLRHSIAVHPLTRGNSGDNTPAVVHYHPVPGKTLKLFVMAKGGGCENASAMAMLPPLASRHGVGDYIVNIIRTNGAAACPPLIIGIGLGGNFETAPLMAKRALLREIGEPSPDPETAKLEKVILQRVNELGIGPQGWGGSITALSMAIETAPCHIASLPVAVNVECHSHRLAEVKI
ncbi:fumarate hydratase [bacterium]|nr:fumarate hydratase [bacterium]